MSRFISSARFRSRILYPLPFITGATYLTSPTSTSTGRSFTSLEGEKRKKDGDKDNKKGEEGPIFDITQKWKETQTEARDFWNKSIFTSQEKAGDEKETPSSSNRRRTSRKQQPSAAKTDAATSFDLNFDKMKSFFGVSDSTDEKETTAASSSHNEDIGKNESSRASDFREMASSFVNVLSGGGSEEAVKRIVKQARQSAEEGDVADKKSLDEVLFVLKQYSEELTATADKFLGDVDLTKLYPTNLFYFMEYEDSLKTPSWKRRMHRFYPGIDINKMDELNDHLKLADLAYADTVEEIQEGLENNKTPYELVFVNTNSQPNKPAHFIAVKRAQPIWSPSLDVIMCVRGTKTITDALTDLFCDYEDYRGGKAHSGILEGGRFLANKHKTTLKNLLKSSGKHKIKLTLIGHSLGAGAASIIGIELNDESDIDVQVIGFGCPALLTKELSEQTKSFVTTVVADDDCVPRLSAATIVNSVLNIMEYNWLPSARRDVDHAFSELQRLYPMIVTSSNVDRVMEFIDPLLDQYLAPTVKAPTNKRMEPILFPPGKCIHFYRDGSGVSGSVVPCDFFNELVISRRMVDDHLFFSGYQQIFLELMRLHHQDHNFQFES